MTTETLETNENQTQEHTSEQENKEVVALKLADKSELLPGNRPVGAKHLQIASTYGSLKRPVEARHLQVLSTYGSLSSVRPVMKSGLDITGTMTVSGNRPIVSSHLHISQDYTIMGNRPVASNQIDDPLLLMGYLD